MKLSLSTLVLLPSLASAFAPTVSSWRGTIILQGTTRADSADEVAEAMRLCKELGSDSGECTVAWDIVEEMDSNDMSAATKPGAPALPHKTEYANLLKAYSFLMDQTREQLEQMKTLAVKIQDLELDDPSVTRLGELSEDLKTALAEAKVADDIFGPNSDEAAGAWETVEDAASGGTTTATTHFRYSEAALTGHHHDYAAVVDPQSLGDALDAFGRIEHLSRLVNIEGERIAFVAMQK